MFQQGGLDAFSQGMWFAAIFFLASSTASAAYLTVSEIFPFEIRAFAISIFCALRTLAGGVGAPSLFARLIATHSRTYLFFGYLLGAVLMLLGALTEWNLGIAAEGQSIEAISKPIQAT